MSQRDHQVEEAKKLVAQLEQIEVESKALKETVQAMEAEQKDLMAKAAPTQARIAAINGEVATKTAELRKIKTAMMTKENEYMAFLEAQPALVHVIGSEPDFIHACITCGSNHVRHAVATTIAEPGGDVFFNDSVFAFV
eukprot:CAMPEP_0206559990 /NCGR_PEP_ID=MMETSP0325_2-20121206/20743_1 /ASSEMBLY_ACC=CAM_ASM_000347 /TAXON_ID=2866 /ORGANISM="Crypthecodinium cohnii, Strain Seligo" /LENGTH=138 /DNA_ID=CAMNT_0054061637 /DNA_START=193 /DNA_END=607 /DNA_ORIENTATION=+